MLALGILIAGNLHFESRWILALFLPLGISCFVFFLRRSQSWILDLSIQVLIILAGVYLQSARRESGESHKLSPLQSESVLIDGWIESEPVRQETKASLVVKSDEVRRADRIDAVRRRILVTLRGIKGANVDPSLQCGSRIVARAMLEPFPFQRNPGEFDYGHYLTLNDIQAVATIAAPEDAVLTKASAVSGFNAFVGAMQRTLYAVMDRYHSRDQSSFLKGVILGYRADLSNEVKQSFMNTGTIHILAVSGSNVAVIVLVLYSMFGLIRFPKRLVSGATILGIVLFMFVTGASPSVVRATIMAIVILVGTMFERKPDVYNSLSAVAIIILLLDSNALFDVGFQLSFAAVISIVYIYPILEKLIRRIPERFEEIKAIDYILKLFAVSLAAQIGTLPFTAYYFGRVSLVSLLANLLVVPLSGLNVLLGVATVVASVISPFIATCYAALNKVLIDFLLGFVKEAGNVPFAYVETNQFGLLHAFIYFSILTILLHPVNPRVVKVGICALLLSTAILLGNDSLRFRSGVLRVTVIDVGQGDAIFVETPGQKKILIDAGPRQFKYDAGERIVVPFLHRNRTGNLDAMVLTHSHGDHIGGAPYILEHTAVRSIYESGAGTSSGLYRNVKEVALAERVERLETRSGQRIDLDSTLRLYILHPGQDAGSGRSLNNTSIVVKLVYGKCSALLVGDAEGDAERKFCRRYDGFLASDILKVGHHGSITSSSGDFLRSARPAMSIVSVGTKNKFGHPSRVTLDRIAKHGSFIRRTDQEGAVVFESDGTAWWQNDWRNGESIAVEKAGGI